MRIGKLHGKDLGNVEMSLEGRERKEQGLKSEITC